MTTRQKASPERLPLRWAVILLGATVLGAIFGALTLIDHGLPAALLAGLAASGTAAAGLHGVIGT